MRLPLLTLVALLFTSLLSAAPERWAETIDRLTANDASQPPPKGGVVFVGSSSIVGWKTLKEDFPGEKVIARGFGGSELADSVYYADRVVIPYQPKAVVLYAGDNDIANRKTPEQVTKDFQAFVAKVHSALPQARIIYIAIKPSPSRWHLREPAQQANEQIAALCAKDPKRLRYVDIWTPMLGANGEPREDLFVGDKLHMNRAGYELWTPLVAAALKE